jgi:hypothetical protein
MISSGWLDGILFSGFIAAVICFYTTATLIFYTAVIGAIHLLRLLPGALILPTLIGGSWLIFRFLGRRQDAY